MSKNVQATNPLAFMLSLLSNPCKKLSKNYTVTQLANFFPKILLRQMVTKMQKVHYTAEKCPKRVFSLQCL